VLVPFINIANPIFENAFNIVAMRNQLIIRKEPEQNIIITDVTNGYTEFVKTRIKSIRRHSYNLERQLIRNRGSVIFCDARAENKPWDMCWNSIIEVESQAWQRTSEASPLHPQHIDLTKKILEKIYHEGELQIYFLYLDKTPLAFVVALYHQKTLDLLVIGYDTRYAKYSTGTILLRKVIECVSQTGCSFVSFGPMIGESGMKYKKVWMNRSIPTKTLLIFRKHSLYGRLDTLLKSSSLCSRLYSKFHLAKHFQKLFFFTREVKLFIGNLLSCSKRK